MVRLTIAGRVNDPDYWRAQKAALSVKHDTVVLEPAELKPLLPADYDLLLEQSRKIFGGKAWEHTAGVFCYTTDLTEGGEPPQYIGDAAAMRAWAWNASRFVDDAPDYTYVAVAREAYAAHVKNSADTFVELVLGSGGEAFGSLVFQLAQQQCPATCAHFLSLLHPTDAPAPATKYVGAKWHRIVPGGFAQGGVLADSAVEVAPLADESYELAHAAVGLLGFANTGPHTAATQLYVTFGAMPTFDRKYVAFGKLADGLATLRKLEGAETVNEVPVWPIVIEAARVYTP
jgi:peptidyl-prolyl cis-trans isomerase-like 6